MHFIFWKLYAKGTWNIMEHSLTKARFFSNYIYIYIYNMHIIYIYIWYIYLYIYIYIYIYTYMYMYLCWWTLLPPVQTLLWLWPYLVLSITFFIFWIFVAIYIPGYYVPSVRWWCGPLFCGLLTRRPLPCWKMTDCNTDSSFFLKLYIGRMNLYIW